MYTNLKKKKKGQIEPNAVQDQPSNRRAWKLFLSKPCPIAFQEKQKH